EGAVEVDARDALPFLRRHLAEGSMATTATDAGIGKAAIDTAEHLERLGKALRDGGFIAHIDLERENAAAGFLELGLGSRILGGIRAPDGDIRSGLGHSLRH